jgi:ABC-type transport system substrate-binding protein
MRRRPLLQALPATLAPAWSAAAAPRKTLRLALSSPETTLDPVQTNSDYNTSVVLSHILEAPLRWDYLARPVRQQPGTAAAMPEVSADGRVFTVRIRPGLYFADHPAFGGRPRELVAQDYVYSIKRFFDPRWNSSDLYLYESLKLPGLDAVRAQAIKTRQPFDYDREVDGLRALDRYTLRITLGVPDPRFTYLLGDPVYMGAVAREVVQFHGDDIGAHPVGTGPFRLKSWRRGSRIVLERSPGFRGLHYDGTPADTPEAREAAAHLAGKTLPLVDEVVLDVIEEAQPRWLSFLEGSQDWIEVPSAFRALAAPQRVIAPYLARRGIRLQRQLRPTWR